VLASALENNQRSELDANAPRSFFVRNIGLVTEGFVCMVHLEKQEDRVATAFEVLLFVFVKGFTIARSHPSTLVGTLEAESRETH
jgi:hypothetical protein